MKRSIVETRKVLVAAGKPEKSICSSHFAERYQFRSTSPHSSDPLFFSGWLGVVDVDFDIGERIFRTPARRPGYHHDAGLGVLDIGGCHLLREIEAPSGVFSHLDSF